MFSKFIKFLFLITSITIVSHASYATEGKEGGNGGGSFVCINDKGEVTKAISQDLWEAISLFKITPNALQGDELQISTESIKKLKPINSLFYKRVKEVLNIIFEKRQILPMRIKATNDSNHILEPFVCESGLARFEQAAFYTIDGEIFYSQFVFEKMESIDKAALTLHEAIYKVLRDYHGDHDSKRTRKIIAYLMATTDTGENLVNDIPSSKFDPNADISNENRLRDIIVRLGSASKIQLEDLSDLGRKDDENKSIFEINEKGDIHKIMNFKCIKGVTLFGEERGLKVKVNKETKVKKEITRLIGLCQYIVQVDSNEAKFYNAKFYRKWNSYGIEIKMFLELNNLSSKVEYQWEGSFADYKLWRFHKDPWTSDILIEIENFINGESTISYIVIL